VSVVIKEVRQLRRDRQLVPMLLIVPAIQLLLFGFAISTDLKGVRLGVVLEDPSAAARQMLGAIEATGAIRVTRTSTDPAALEGWLDSGLVDVAIRVPRGFSAAIARGESPVVQVISDGTDPNKATLAYQRLSRAAIAWAARARENRLRGHPEEAAGYAGVPRVSVEARFWYNPALKSVNFQIPGVLAVIAMALTLTPTTIVVVKERELGTLEQLQVTPIAAAELLIGKTVPIAALGLLTALATMWIAQWFFGVPVPAWQLLPFLGISTLLLILNTLGLGLLLSIFCQTQLQAQLLASFVTTPMIMLSGFLFPIENMPWLLQQATWLLPMRHYMIIVRGVFLKGQNFPELWGPWLWLLVLGVLLYAAGILSFRKQVA
jgi:ABC-2 type transport system permease protein